MKSFRKFISAVLACMAVCMLVLFWLAGRMQIRQRDTVFLNDIVQTVRSCLAQQEEPNLPDFGTPVLIFKSSGALLYASPGADADIKTAAEAMQNGYLCMPVTDQDRFLGTAAVQDPVQTEYSRIQRRLLLTAGAGMLMILAVLLIVGLYLHRNVAVPFRRMQQFAETIAQGRLDDPLLMEKNNPFGSFTESFDIMREALRDARHREEVMKQREKELAASLSHDIKTPVTGIKLICELLTVKTDDPYIRGKVESINQKAEQIHVLADDLLTAALEELGEMQVQCRDISSEILHTLLTDHDTRGLVRAEPVPECMIHADIGRLSQVIANIISNSYKYAGTEISVRSAFQEKALAVTIADTGGGIPEEELDLVTTKYYRGRSNAGGKEGSGLGLYISSELMRRMGGGLICENRDGGFAVTLLIPLS